MAHRVWWLRSFVVLAALAALGALATHSAVQGGGQDKQLKTNKELEVPWQEHNQKYFPLIRGDKKADKDEMVHDSVRLSGLKGLAEMPPARVYSILDAGKKDPALDAQKKRDLERVDTLLAFIKRDMPQNVTPDAERFIRRQALRALAQ